MPRLVPPDELVSRIEAELVDMQHLMDVCELIQGCLLIKLGIDAIDDVFSLVITEPFLHRDNDLSSARYMVLIKDKINQPYEDCSHGGSITPVIS